jgi:hypothetical protein
LGERGLSVQIVYNPGSGDVTLTFVRGPVDFNPYWDGRVHNNLSVSGLVRERVVENLDILISWSMPNMILTVDLSAWASFESFALGGGTFQLYPCSTLSDYYNCVAEDAKWTPKRNAPAKYGAQVVVRILNDGQCPTGPDIVLRRFYGVTP